MYVHIILITCAGQVSPLEAVTWLKHCAKWKQFYRADQSIESKLWHFLLLLNLPSSRRLIKCLSNGWTRERTHVVVANIVTLVINDFIVSILRHTNKCSLLRSSQVNKFAHPWRYRINLNGIYCRRFRHEQRLRPYRPWIYRDKDTHNRDPLTAFAAACLKEDDEEWGICCNGS